MNKRTYEGVLPQSYATVSIPTAQCLLENKRTHFYLCNWLPEKELSYFPILKIGDGEGEVSADTLGFKEIYFQWFVPYEQDYYVWPIEDEAFLQPGFHLTYKDYKFQKSDKIADIPLKLMRPTAVVAKEPGRIFMLGGDKDRKNLVYDVNENKWQYVPMLPEGHNITCVVCTNFHNRAIFTVIVDARMQLRIACLDLDGLTPSDSAEGYDKEMYWSFGMRPEDHKIERFHIKGALIMDHETICVSARGRLEGMKEQIAQLFLYLKVTKGEDGKYKVEFVKNADGSFKIQKTFPTIFPRQLDTPQKSASRIVTVQDTPDEEAFEIVSVNTEEIRPDGRIQHTFHCANKPVDAPQR